MNCSSEYIILSNSSLDEEKIVGEYEQCLQNYYLNGENSSEICLANFIASSNVNKNVDSKIVKKFEDCVKNETKPGWTTSQIVWTVIGVLFLLLIILSAINQYQDEKRWENENLEFKHRFEELRPWWRSKSVVKQNNTRKPLLGSFPEIKIVDKRSEANFFNDMSEIEIANFFKNK